MGEIGDRGELWQVSENTVTSVMEVLQRINSLYPCRYAGAEESENNGEHCFTWYLIFVSSGGWWIFFWGGAVAHWHSKQFHNKSNRQADLDPAPLPLVFLPKFSSQTDIGVEIVQS